MVYLVNKKNMTTSASRVQVRIDNNLKKQAESIMRSNGFNPSQLIHLIYFNIVKTKELPIIMKKIPNDLTQKTIKDAENGVNLIKCENLDDCFSQLKS